jgi:uncharacterized protein
MSGFHIGGVSVPAGTRETINLEVSTLANATRMNLPVHVVHGGVGPVMFLSGVVHGDEILGLEIIRRVLARDELAAIPGSDQGSLSSLLADLFFREVVKRSHYGIDLHTAALHRTNLPQVRISPGDDELARLAEAFAPPVILTSKLREGSLRQCAKDEGVHVLLYEGGEALRFDETAIEAGVKGVLRVMQVIGMITSAPRVSEHAKVTLSSSSSWVRAPEGGILHSVRQVGDKVGLKEPIAIITDPLGTITVPVFAEDDGIIIGRTNLPIVNRGDALFHVARIKTKGKAPILTTPDEDEII